MFSLLSLNPFSSTEKGDSRTKKVGSSDLLGQSDTRLTSPNKTDLQTLHVNYTRYHLATNKIPPIVYIFCFALRLIFVILAFVSFGYDNIVLGNNGAMELRIKTITVTHSHVFNNTYRRTDYQNVFTGGKTESENSSTCSYVQENCTTGHSPVIYL